MATVTDRIKEFNKSLLKESVQVKYARLAENEFRFFRGTCHLFYEDLFNNKENFPSSPAAWICGDLHLENFGSFKGNNRLVYFDLNDFGEAILAPALWEIVRLITSIFVALDSLRIDTTEAEKLATLFLATYSHTLRKGKALYIEPQVAKGVVREFLTHVAERKTKELLRDRITGGKYKPRLLIDNDRHYALDENLKQELYTHIREWSANNKKLKQYHCLDIAFRIAGTGSIGINRYCFLLQHSEKSNNFLLLDMKEVSASSLLPYITIAQPKWSNESERICTIEEYMQNNSPALLGSARFRNKDYVIRELQPSSDKIDFKLIRDNSKDLGRVISDMAILTASAQLRSAGRKGAAIPDDLIAFGHVADWHTKLLDYSRTYSQTVKKYYRQYMDGYSAGVFN